MSISAVSWEHQICVGGEKKACNLNLELMITFFLLFILRYLVKSNIYSHWFQVTPSELTTFANNYSSPEFFQANGLTLAGIRFIFLSGTDRVLRAKKNKSGLHCMKTEKGK